MWRRAVAVAAGVVGGLALSRALGLAGGRPDVLALELVTTAEGFTLALARNAALTPPWPQLELWIDQLAFVPLYVAVLIAAGARRALVLVTAAADTVENLATLAACAGDAGRWVPVFAVATRVKWGVLVLVALGLARASRPRWTGVGLALGAAAALAAGVVLGVAPALAAGMGLLSLAAAVALWTRPALTAR